MTGAGLPRGPVWVGWRLAPAGEDPGPPPRRPAPPDWAELDPGWLAAQRREERRIGRPCALGGVTAVAGLAAALALARARWLSPGLTALAVAACGLGAGWACWQLWRAERGLRDLADAERRRVQAARAAQQRELAARQQEHAAQFREWEARRAALPDAPRWAPVILPAGVDRLDVLGGTLAGWSALLTTMAGPLLAAGGEVTVVDLSGGAVAAELVRLATGLGRNPLVWVLPGDLDRLDLGVGMPSADLSDVLAVSAAAAAGGPPGADGHGGVETARDQALIELVLRVLGAQAGMAETLAGLRVLAQIGDPREDVARGLLTVGQFEELSGLFGRGAADRVVVERAWTLEARLRGLEPLGRDAAALPAGPLRVIALDPGAGSAAGPVTGTYTVVALTRLLRRLPPGPPWRHTVCLLGAETLGAAAVDGLSDACAARGAGLVLAYRSAPAAVRARLGRGNAALAFMRLGNAEDAKAASEQIGTQHRFVVSQLTETIGMSVTDTFTGSYTSTVGDSESASASSSASQTSGHSTGAGSSRSGGAPFGQGSGSQSRERSSSTSASESLSLTESISTSTSWGTSTAAAIGASGSLARAVQRSREFLVEAHELQRLPPTAVIVSYAGPRGREAVLADANPGLAALPAQAFPGGGPGSWSQTAPLAPDPDRPGAAPPASQPTPAAPGPGLSGATAPPPAAAGPNLGPPPEPPDWRGPRRRGPQ